MTAVVGIISAAMNIGAADAKSSLSTDFGDYLVFIHCLNYELQKKVELPIFLFSIEFVAVRNFFLQMSEDASEITQNLIIFTAVALELEISIKLEEKSNNWS